MAWNLTKQRIIKRALRLIGAVPQGDSPTPEQVSEASEALNALMKSMIFGTKLWKVRTYTRSLEATTEKVVGTDGAIYNCRRGHLSTAANRPGSGEEFLEYWEANAEQFNAFEPGEDYSIGDRVYADVDGWRVFVSLSAHTAAATFEDDDAEWTEDTSYTSWVANTQYKNIGDILLNEATLDVFDINYRVLGEDKEVELIDQFAYFEIQNKDETDDKPTCAWVEKHLLQRIHLHKKATTVNDYVLVIQAEEVIDDLISPNQNADIHVKYIDLICHGLALRLAPEYGVPLTERQSLKVEFRELLALLKIGEKETDDDTRVDPGF